MRQRIGFYPLYKKTELGEVYADLAKLTAQGFYGRAIRQAWHFSFRSLEALEKHVDQFFKGLECAREYKEKYKQERKDAGKAFLEKLIPGAILCDSWGYEQTQVEFYKVLSREGSKVTIAKMTEVTVPGSEGRDCDHVMPGEVIGAPEEHIVRSDRIKISSCISLSLWDGKARYRSWYY